MSNAQALSQPTPWLGAKLGFERHPFQLAIEKQRDLSEGTRPFLRHSWNRVDCVAVVSFWIMFILAITGAEQNPYHIYIFRALSVLRVSRLLAVTSGTTVRFEYLLCTPAANKRPPKTIMRSLKIAGPLLVNVAAFVLFAMVLFSFVIYTSEMG